MVNEVVIVPEKCVNCKYCRNLSVFNRELELSRKNVLGKIKINKNDSKYTHSLCCIVFQKDDVQAPIYETNRDDLCERYVQKGITDVYDIDDSSMYDTKMISLNLYNDNKGKLHIDEKKED